MENYPGYTGSDICALQAHEVVALLRRKEISPAELIDAAQARHKAVDGQVNAMPVLCPDRAREAAQGDDEASLLAGLPVGIKDLSAVAGVRSTYGTKGLAGFVPEHSDPVVQQIEARGGLVLGKTNTPEMGAGGNTFNDVFGATLNPWNTALNAGGSSGGAAVSLATGQVWLSHGSDHGGSLRTPAAYCGIVGLRPSPGRVPGASAAGFMLEGQEGPMARSVRDCALFLDAMAGYHPAAPLSYPAEEAPFSEAVAQAEGKLRIAFSPDLNGLSPVEPDMAEALSAAMAQMGRAGAQVEEVTPDLTGLERTYHSLRGLGMAASSVAQPERIKQHFKQTLKDNMAFGLSLSAEDIARAQIGRTRIYHEMRRLLDKYDVLACPVVGNLPRPQNVEWVPEVNGVKLEGYMDWLRFAFLATTAGLPAISVPIGFARGLPVAVQLIGPPRGEARLLAAARAVEAECGGPMRVIDPVAG